MRHQSMLSNGPIRLFAFFLFAIGLASVQAQISTFPFTENFDSEPTCATSCGSTCTLTGNFVNVTSDDMDWTVDANGTGSSGTGPNGDNTTGTGNYLYTETSGCNNLTAHLESPTFDFSALTSPVLEFYYHMVGATMGTLEVSVSTNGGLTWTSPVFSLSGPQQTSQTDPYLLATVSLCTYAGNSNVKFRITAITGTSFTSDMAIDDIEVKNASGCIAPALQPVSNLSSNSADLQWSDVCASSYDWEVVPAGNAQGLGVVASGNTSGLSATASGLMSNTPYDIYVRANCGTAGTSTWSGPLGFRTLCAPFTATYSESFDGTIAPALDPCWTVLNESNSTSGNIYTTSFASDPINSPPNSVEFYNFNATTGKLLLISPLFSDLDNTKQVRFNLQDEGSTFYAADLYVGLMTDPTDTGTFVPIDTIPRAQFNSAAWQQFIVNFSSYTGSGGHVAFMQELNGSFDYLWIDDFVYEVIPACPVPSGLSTANLGANAVDLDWTENGSATQWEISYGPAGSSPGAGTQALVSSRPFNLSGLSPSTSYDWYVRAICGPNDTSAWSAVNSFSTTFLPPQGFTCLSGNSGVVFSDDFDVQGAWTGDFSTSSGFWDYQSGPTGSSNTGPSGAHSGSNYIYFEASTGGLSVASVVSPAIDLTAGNNFAELSFWLHAYGADMGTLDVGVGNSATGPFTNVFSVSGQQQTASSDPWLNAGVNLDAYVGQTIYLQFTYTRNGTGFAADLSVDLVEVSTCLSCAAPSSLLSSNVSTSSADLDWTETGSATQWQISYGPSGISAAAGTKALVSSRPYNLSGLSSNTPYDWYVRAICAPGDTSPWTGPASFSTLFACPSGAVCATYTSGDIPTDFNFRTLPGTSACPATLSLNIPAGNKIDSLSTDYQMTAQTGAWQSEQRSWLYSPTTTTGEGAISSGPPSNTGGTASYSRNNLSFANGATGAVDIQMHAGRTWGGSGCNTTYNKVDDGTWRVIAYYSPVPACLTPTALVSSSAGRDSVVLDWTENGSATQWQVSYGLSGTSAAAGQKMLVNSKPTTLNGLVSNAGYDWFVRAICGPGDTSSWSIVSSFNTLESAPQPLLCSPGFAAGVIFSDDMESNTGWTGDIGFSGGDWDFPTLSPGGNSSSTGPSGPQSGTTYAEFEASGAPAGPADIISPPIDLTTATGPLELSFYYHAYGANMGDLEVSIGNSATGPFTPLFLLSGQQQTAATDPWNQVGLDISAYQGQTVYLRFRYTFVGGSFTGDMAIDLIEIQSCLSCPAPSNLSAANLTSTSADLAWLENGSAAQWEISYGAPGFVPGSGTQLIASSNPYLLSGLLSNTDYQWYVRAICGPADTSGWSGPNAFTTPCSPFSAPYTQNWDATVDPAIDDCWKVVLESSSTFPWIQTENLSSDPQRSSPNSVEFYNSSAVDGKLLLVSPQFSDLDNTKQARFFLQDEGSTAYAADLYVGIMDDPNDTSTFTVLDTIERADFNSSAWTEFTVSFNNYTGTGKYFAFSFELNGSFDYVWMDDFVYETAPNCPSPNALTAGSFTQTSAELSWQENGTATVWHIEYDTAGFSPSGTPTLAGITNKPYTLSGLQPGTSYEFYVQADCGTDSSTWAGPFTFSTLPGVVCATGLDTTVLEQEFDAVQGWTGDINSGNGSWLFPSSGFTGSGSTGPSGAHSGLNYAYVETSGASGQVAHLVSPLIDLSNAKNEALLSFYLHAYGATIGTLDVQVSTSGPSGPYTTLQTFSGQIQTDELDPFVLITEDLSPYLGQAIYLRFQYTVGTSFTGDLALDLIQVHTCLTCFTPSGLTASNLSPTSVDLSWLSGGASNWEVEYGLSGFAPGSGTRLAAGVNSNFTVSGLSDATTYDFYVRDSCGLGDVSPFFGPLSITTPCLPKTAPYAENFDGAPAVDPFAGIACWDVLGTGANDIELNSAPDFGVDLPPSAPNAVELNDGDWPSDSAILVSPQFSDLPTGNNRIRFKAAFEATGQDLYVGVLTNPNDASSFTPLDTINTSVEDVYAEYTVDLANTALIGSAEHIGFAHGPGFFEIYVDDFVYEFNPCDTPTALGATDIASTMAKVFWTPGEAANFVVEYGISGFALGSGTQALAASDTLLLTGLSPLTTYDFYVRDSCGPGYVSAWQGPFSFTTLCPPTPLTRNDTVYLNVFGNAIVSADSVDNNSNAACPIASKSVSPSAFNCSNLGNNTVSLTVTNSFGESNSANATVTVLDTVAPTVNLQNATAYLDASGTVTIDSSLVDNGSFDACGVASITVSPSVFTCSEIGNNLVTVTVTDGSGNSQSGTTTVTILDTVAPNPVAQNINLYLDGSGTASIDSSDINNGSSDACGIASISLSKTAFACADIGMNTIIMTVTDLYGNSASTTANVMVIDTIDPLVITSGYTAYLDASGAVTINGANIDGGSIDACGVASVSANPSSFACGQIGANPVVLTVTDNNGNSAVGNTTVTVLDTIKPTLNLQNVNAYLDASGAVSIDSSDVDNGSSDACGIASIALSQSAFGCAEVGANSIAVTVTDNNGNSASGNVLVNVIDTISPLALGQNITLYLDASGTASIDSSDVDNGSSDNCALATLGLSQSVFTCADLGANNLTLTATDVNGNSASTSLVVTVLDTISPQALAVNYTGYLDASGNLNISASDVNAGSNDACGIASVGVFPNAFTCADVGPNVVSLNVVDNQGNNSTATATVTVLDSIRPSLSLNSPTLYLNASGLATLDSAAVDNGSSDACGISSLVLSQGIFGCGDLGMQSINVTATDANGNSSTASLGVMVLDTIRPQALTQNANLFLDGNGQATLNPLDVDGGSTDNCSIAIRQVDTSNYDCSDLGPNTVWFYVTDPAGNMDSAQAIVTVIDTISPTITTRPYTAYLDASGQATIQVGDVSSGTSNACSIDTVFLDRYVFGCADIGANLITVTANAAGGAASTTATAVVTVVDTISPAVVAQTVVLYLDANGQGSVSASQVNNGSSDACGVASLAISQTNFDCSHLGTNPVQLTVIDVNGNSQIGTGFVEVRDTIKPQPLSRSLTVYLDASGTAGITPAMVDAGTADNCSAGLSLSLSKALFNCADEGLNQEWLIATDTAGNVDSVSFLITVLDTIHPILITKNITIQLGANGQASISPTQLDGGSFDNCANQLFFTASQTTFDCSHLGSNMVFVTVTDINGNTSNGMALVAVEDNIAPLVVANNTTLYLDGNGQASLNATAVDGGSSDNCGIDSLWLAQNQFDCNHLGLNSVVLYARDEGGNQTSSNVLVTVLDTILPNAQAQNKTVYLDSNGQASLTLADLDNGSADNCGLAQRTLSQTNFSCSDVGVQAVTLMVSDSAGNSDQAVAQVTVIDSLSPQVVVQNISVNLDANGQATVSPMDVDGGSSDNCGLANMSLLPNSFTCADTGFNTAVLTVTDIHGNQSSAVVTLEVRDLAAPQMLAQNHVLYLDATGQATLSPGDLDAGSTDNCGTPALSVSKSSFSCADLGVHTIALTGLDASGNSAGINVQVTVLDTLAPLVLGQNRTVYLDINGTASVTALDLDAGSSDNCALSSLSIDQASFDCSHVGTNSVNLTATDQSGNSQTTAVMVTVLDTLAPAVVGQNITVQLDANGLANVSANDVDNGSSDNCALSSLSLSPNSFTCADTGNNAAVLTATDVYGNTRSTNVVIAIEDRMAPVARTQSLTLYLGANGQASISPADVDNGSSDNCAAPSLSLDRSNFSCADLGSNTVNLTATDGSGNTHSQSATVSVLDSTRPQVITQNITAYLNSNGTVSIGPADLNNGSADNCNIVSYALDRSTFGCSDVGVNTVNLSALDQSGNQATASAQVTIVDTVSPVVQVRSFSLNLDANGQATLSAADLNNGSSDACGISGYSISQSNFTCADRGSNSVILTVTDNHGNQSSAAAMVTVIDPIAPVVNTQNATVYLNAAGQASITAADLDNGSTDNCGIASRSLSLSNFSCADLGANLVNLTVTDSSGNSATASATVNVLDTIRPTLGVLPGTITAYATAGQCGANVNWSALTASDNCGSAQLSLSQASGSFFGLGTTTVSATATDASGNITSGNFTVNVVDTISPIFTSVPTNIVVNANATSCDATVNWSLPNATDNCTGVTLTSSHSSGGTFPVGTTTVTYTATDGNGNSRSISFDVTVTDQVAPSISNVPANITVSSDPGACSATVNYASPSVSDNCTGATLSNSHPAGTVFPVGNTTVILTATDGAGNTATASFEVRVLDQEAPTALTVPASDTVGECNAVYSYSLPTGTDNCSAVGVRQVAGLPSGAVFPAGTTLNQFELSDASGNLTLVSFSITVIPSGQPQLPTVLEICENEPSFGITLGQNIVWTGPGVINAGTGFDPASAGRGRHQLNYLFTDERGCTVSGSIFISVNPTPPVPVITRIASTTLSTGNYTTYQWYRNGVAIPGANQQTYTYTEGGNYQVMVSNSLGCSVYGDGYQVGAGGSGIGLEETLLQVMELYPNPSRGVVHLNFRLELDQAIDITLFSVEGKKVYEALQQEAPGGFLRLDLGDLPTATYYLYIRSGQAVEVRKLILKK